MTESAIDRPEVSIEIAGEHVSLMAEHALYWPRSSTLLVADAHFGKAATFRAGGIFVPRGTTTNALTRLDDARPFCNISLNPFAKLAGRAADRQIAELHQPGAQRIGVHRCGGRPAQKLHDGDRRRGRRDQAEHERRIDAGEPGLRHGRLHRLGHVGEGRKVRRVEVDRPRIARRSAGVAGRVRGVHAEDVRAFGEASVVGGARAGRVVAAVHRARERRQEISGIYGIQKSQT